MFLIFAPLRSSEVRCESDRLKRLTQAFFYCGKKARSCFPQFGHLLYYRQSVLLPQYFSVKNKDKDLDTKSKIYAEVGIIEYWVVNLKKLQLVVFREPTNGEYASKLTLTTGTIQPLAFPDVSISVEQIING